MTIWLPNIETNKPRHTSIVESLADDIASGKLRPGDRLPTHRELADSLGVSVGTVTRAYNSAERRGLIRGETGRGTFVDAGARDTFAITDAGVSEPGVIDLGVTWPLYDLDPDLGPTLRRLARSPDLAELLHYQPNAGMQRHREAGVAWARRFGVDTDRDSVLVCAGSQHAITVALGTIAEPGDTVFAAELTYPGFRALASFLRLRTVGLPMDKEGIVPEGFESACRQRRGKALYCTPTLQNPTTSTMPEKRRRRIAEIARKYDVAIVEDAVHQLLCDDPPPPISCFAPEISFFVASMSKVVTGALRIAYLVVPPGAASRVAQNIWATNWMAAPITGEIASTWIADGTADETVRRKKDEAQERINVARWALEGHALSWGTWSHHVWLELPPQWESAAQFAECSRKAGVAVTPADVFTVGNTRPAKAVRISLSAPRTRSCLQGALETLRRTLSEPPGLGPAIV